MPQRDLNPNHRLFEERERARIEGAMRGAAAQRASSIQQRGGVQGPPFPRIPRGREEIEATSRERPWIEKPESGLKQEAQRIDEAIGREGAGQEVRHEFAKKAREMGMTPPGGKPGIPAVLTALQDVDFPTHTDHIINDRGDHRVEVAKDVKPPLRDVLCQIGEGEYDSLDELEQALHKNWNAVMSLEVDRGVASRRRRD